MIFARWLLILSLLGSFRQIYAQSLISVPDEIRREAREIQILRGSETGFLGYRPSSFEEFSSLSGGRNYFLNLRMNYSSLYETPEKVTAFRADPYPLTDYQLMNGAQGLKIPRGESVWTSPEMIFQPVSWLNLNGEGAFGYSFSNRERWAHLSKLFAEFRWNKIVFSIGRKPIFWGQSAVSPLIFSSNATPMDSLQLVTLPSTLPWLFSMLGPVKAEIFISRMNDYRVNAHDYFFGYRLGAMPFERFEMNGAFAYQFGGKGVDGGSWSETLVELMGGRTSKGSGIDDSSNITNRAMEMDFRLHFKDWNIPTSFYTEQHFEDCCGFGNLFRRSYSYTWGGLFLSSSSEDASKFRVEYSRIANKTYFHLTWLSGWSNDGRYLGHPSGRDSQFVSLSYENPFGRKKAIVISPFWQQKDRRGRVDRYWIQEYNPAFQESEQRVGVTVKMNMRFNENWDLMPAAGWTRVFQKYSRADYDTSEWGMVLSLTYRN